jgi:hypothetical protein
MDNNVIPLPSVELRFTCEAERRLYEVILKYSRLACEQAIETGITPTTSPEEAARFVFLNWRKGRK